ncbi:MAG TPA: PIN domain nuclease [Gammaproteobacteria bacterium]|nr:PIN domain nuclease [Gammaproteobacteria bacterium]
MNAWLIDTGPIVAYLDASDPTHNLVVEHIDAFTGRLLTTGAVITEAMHFVSSARRGPRLLADLIGHADVAVYDLAQEPELREAAALMERYSDTPMDYADATLVLLSEAAAVTDVLTLDRRGFTTYRTRRGRAFRLVLDR